MKILNTDGSILMEIQSLERVGNNIEFRGTVMGAMPARGKITPKEARGALKLIKSWKMSLFLLTFMLRK